MREVAAIAVAKDEGCYLGEFIHHHLYFGFDHIFIAVNRTTDHSEAILDRIHRKFDNVHVLNVDWMDCAKFPKETKNLRIQQISYAFLIHHIRQAYRDVNYVLPIDIDEFWFPGDFSTPVTDFLTMTFDVLSFHWLCQDGEEKPFLPPFATTSVTAARHVKSILNLDSECPIDTLRNHTPLLKNEDNVIHLDSGGCEFHPRLGQLSSELKLAGQRAFVLHRMVRSEEEYLYLMLRGNTDSNAAVKPNRKGFRFLRGRFDLDLPKEKLDAYHNSLAAFLEYTGIEALVDQDRKNLLNGSQELLRMSARDLLASFEHIINGFVGTAALDRFLETLSSAEDLTSDQIDKIREKAVSLKDTKAELSEKLMRLAEGCTADDRTVRGLLGRLKKKLSVFAAKKRR